jgi:signal transduction histidine kinase
MSINAANPRSESAVTRTLHGFWARIVTVPPTDPEQESAARLVATVSATMLILTIASAVWMLSSATVSANSAIALVSAGVLLGMYLLNRQGQYNAAALGLIGVFSLVPTALALGSGKDLALLGFAAILTSISVPLANTLFPQQNWRRAVLPAALILFLALPILHPVYSFADVLYAVIGLAASGIISLVYTLYRVEVEYQRLTKLETANKLMMDSEAALKQANKKLDQQVKDSTIELEATVAEFELAKEEADRAREEAVRANTVKSAFLASMSHELRTPLNAIINFTKFVARGDLGPINAEQEETLQEVIESGKHLLSLINDVLDMSKIESGTLNLFIEDNINLRSLIDTAVMTGKTYLAEKPVELKVEVDDALPLLRCDRQRILQVLINVVSNACKFTEKGSITVQAHVEDDDVIVMVKDTGRGIAPEDQSLVFDAFKQTETGLRQGGGTGLGMPISKNLIETHGGQIRLESEVNQGTTFFITLPIKSERLTPIFTLGEKTQ